MAAFTVTSDNSETALDVFSTDDGSALYSEALGRGHGVIAKQTNLSADSSGLWAEAHGKGHGVVAKQINGAADAAGLFAESRGKGPGIHARQANPNSDGAAIFAEHVTGKTAGYFKGNVIVTGDVSLPGADCAEEFAIADAVQAEPGTVMVLGRDGALVPCGGAYERTAVGVIAGARSHGPGIVLGRRGTGEGRQPIALVGTVFCKADAAYGTIAIGDMMTTSPTPGHAMRADDPMRAFGAVIGKAMAPLDEGTGLIPILIALQ